MTSDSDPACMAALTDESSSQRHAARWSECPGYSPGPSLPNALAWSQSNLLALACGRMVHVVDARQPRALRGVLRAESVLRTQASVHPTPASHCPRLSGSSSPESIPLGSPDSSNCVARLHVATPESRQSPCASVISQPERCPGTLSGRSPCHLDGLYLRAGLG